MSFWDCKYQSLYNTELLGKCLYFLKFKKEPPPIPNNVVDVGCKHFIKIKRHPLRIKIIEQFRS